MKICTVLAALIITVTLYAQSPEKMSYQAVVRNTNNQLVTNQDIGIQISILQNSASGTDVYVETQLPTTNANGLISIEIGGANATIVSGNFSAIDWSNDIYFIKTDIDPAGGTNYTITGTSQLLSVPYALYSKTAESIAGGINETDPVFTNWDKDYNDLTNTPNIVENVAEVLDTTTQFVRNEHYVGELYAGGIVFYVYENGQHGLIACLDDLDGGNGVAWSDVTDVEIGSTAQSFYSGATNTDAIIAQQTSTSAAQLCRNLGAEWYLPASWELNLLYNSAFIISKILENDNDSSTNGFNGRFDEPTFGYYWSSTERHASGARSFYFSNGFSKGNFKNNTYRVRAIKAF